MPKILINALTLEDANLTPLLKRIKFWNSHGYSITVLGTIFLKKRLTNSEFKSIKLVTIPHAKRPANKLWFALEAFKRFLLSFRFLNLANEHDVIFSVSSVADLVLLPSLMKLVNPKIRWLTVFDNTVKPYQLGESLTRLIVWISFLIALKLLLVCDHVFTVTPLLKKYLVSQGISGKKVTVTGNGLETDLILKAKKSSKIDIDALYLGRLHPEKGIYDLIEATYSVTQKLPGFQLYLAGQGDPETEANLKKIIKQRRLTQNIKFLGFVSGQKKFNLIKSSKVFVCLSHAESFGVAVLEAVCTGVPVVAYDLPVYHHLYSHKYQPYLFPRQRIDLVALKIISLIKKGPRLKKVSPNFIKSYSWESIAATEMDNFYDKNNLRLQS